MAVTANARAQTSSRTYEIRPGRLSVLVSASMLAFVSAAPAMASKNHSIVPGQGIAGVRLGEREAQVKHALGKPRAKSPIAAGESEWEYGHLPNGLIVGFRHGSVNGMWTADSQYQTATGVSVLSTPAQVTAAYPEAVCTPGTGPAPGPGETSLACVIQSRSHGQTVKTSFEWRSTTKSMEWISVDLVPSG